VAGRRRVAVAPCAGVWRGARVAVAPGRQWRQSRVPPGAASAHRGRGPGCPLWCRRGRRDGWRREGASRAARRPSAPRGRHEVERSSGKVAWRTCVREATFRIGRNGRARAGLADDSQEAGASCKRRCTGHGRPARSRRPEPLAGRAARSMRRARYVRVCGRGSNSSAEHAPATRRVRTCRGLRRPPRAAMRRRGRAARARPPAARAPR
jgi:hypothetical protein